MWNALEKRRDITIFQIALASFRDKYSKTSLCGGLATRTGKNRDDNNRDSVRNEIQSIVKEDTGQTIGFRRKERG